MKKILFVCLSALVVLTLTLICAGCGPSDPVGEHEHSGGVADCLNPARCEICGIYYGEARGHISDATCSAKATCTDCGAIYDGALPHTYLVGSNECSVCHDKYSLGLYYTLSDDGKSYRVSSLGTCTDAYVVVPSTYNGLPVTAIDSFFFQTMQSNNVVGVVLPCYYELPEENPLRSCDKLVEICNLSDIEVVENGDRWDKLGYKVKSVCTSLADKKITTTEDGFSFYGDDNGAYLIGYVGNDAVLELPDNYLGKPYEIHPYAFFNTRGIKSVTVSEGVTSIGEYAFFGCSVENVTISKTVTSIGDYAFATDTLRSVDIAEGVTEIGAWAFTGAADLKEIHLPDSVSTISDCAFYGTGLISVRIGKNLATVGTNAFGANYSLKEVVNDSSLSLSIGSEDYGHIATCAECIRKSDETSILSRIDDFVFSETDGELMLVGYLGNEIDITLPEGYNGRSYGIAANAFSGNIFIVKLTIPAMVTSVEENAFYYCEGLRSITIGPDVSTFVNTGLYTADSLFEIINRSALDIFESKDYDRVKRKISGNADSTVSITADGFILGEYGNNYLLGYVGDETSVTAGDLFDGDSYEIYDYAFYFDFDIKEITFSDNVTAIGEHAFYFCSNLTSVTMSDSITRIDEYAFYVCASIDELRLPANLTKISESAFEACNRLRYIELPEGLTEIGWSAFNSCYDLESITLPSTLKKIETQAFHKNNSLRTVVVPEGVTYVGDLAFSYCTLLESLSVPTSLTYFGVDVVCESNRIIFHELNNAKYLGNESVKTVVLVCVKENATSCTIDESTKIIAPCAFASSAIESISIPNSVIMIGERSFLNCEKLTEVTMGAAVASIMEYAFSHCTSLTSITIPSGVSFIGTGAFYNCTSLAYVKYSAVECEIQPEDHVDDKTVFNNVGASLSATFVVISSDVRYIGYMAFKDFENAVFLYEGTRAEFESIIFSEYGYPSSCFDEDAIICFYSESEPAGDDYYWHYVDGAPVIWEN